jgi:integrase
MRSRVRLLARIPAASKTGNKYLCWQQVKTTPKGLPKFVNEYVDARAFALRYTLPGGQRKTETLASKDWNEVCSLLAEKEVEFERMERGLDHAVAGQVEKTDREAIADAVERFLRDREATNSSPNTLAQYRVVLNTFRNCCGKLFVDELADREVIADYLLYLRKNTARRTKGEQINNTLRDRLKKVSAFYSFNGLTFPLPRKEWPTEIEKEVTVYTREELDRMLSSATEDETDLILFFLNTGMRDKEVACAYFSDIDFKAHSVTVRPKPEWGFRIKSQKPRTIKLPETLIDRLTARQERVSGSLIFPNRNNRPDDDLIQKVRNAARRAGMSDEEVTLHRFRRTFGTRVAELHGVRNAQELLGHADIETTTRYLAPTATNYEGNGGLFADVKGAA